MYVLVLLREEDAARAAEIDHEPFIDTLVGRNLVLLGGPFTTAPLPGVSAAYVLRCDDPAHAEALVAADPLVAAGACSAVLTGWELVGINLAAVDPEFLPQPPGLVSGPDDPSRPPDDARPAPG